MSQNDGIYEVSQVSMETHTSSFPLAGSKLSQDLTRLKDPTVTRLQFLRSLRTPSTSGIPREGMRNV